MDSCKADSQDEPPSRRRQLFPFGRHLDVFLDRKYIQILWITSNLQETAPINKQPLNRWTLSWPKRRLTNFEGMSMQTYQTIYAAVIVSTVLQATGTAAPRGALLDHQRERHASTD